MAGDRNTEPAPWERAARQADGDGWYGQRRGGDGGAAGGAYDDDGYGGRVETPGRFVDDVPEPRRGRSAPYEPQDVRGARGSVPAARSASQAFGYDDEDQDDLPPRGGRGGGRGGGGAVRAGGDSRFNAKAVVLASTASLLVTTIGTSAFAYQHYNSSIQTSSSNGLSNNRPPEAKANAQGQKPMNILLIGSDARDNGNRAFGGGQVNQGARSDTTILLHIYADHQHAVGISIPRDLKVEIPPCLYDPNDPKGFAAGRKTGTQQNQFNAAFSIGNSPKGNVACEVNTIEAMSGTKVRIDHTVVVDFQAFATITEDINGVTVCVPNDVHDGSIVFKKGVQVVKGQTALDYVRERDAFGDGSDIGRTRRQQAFLGEMLKKVQSDGILSDATRTSMVINGALKTMTFDQNLGSLAALSALASDMKGLNPAHVQFLTLPGHYDDQRVGINQAAADAIWSALANDQLLDGSGAAGSTGTTTAAETTAPTAPATTTAETPAVPPASIKITVENGTKTTGLAADGTAALMAAGYNATVSRQNVPNIAVTTISYGSAKQEAAARQLQALYPGSELKATKSGSSTILVTLGADYAAAHPTKAGAGTPGGSAPGSTAPSALPTEIANNSRTAADNACTGITAGFGAGTG